MKRELAFALSTITEIDGCSIGRTRSSKAAHYADVSDSKMPFKKRRMSDSMLPLKKRRNNNHNLLQENEILVDEANTAVNGAIKGVDQTEEVQLNSLDQVRPDSGASDDPEKEMRPVVENGSTEVSVSTPTKKLEMKMSKKIGLIKVPKTVAELLTTGLLEGYPVFYNGDTEASKLRGLIKDAEILCLCSSCLGLKVFTPSKFEQHACDLSRRAAQYICFENGASLQDVVRACRQSCLDSVEDTIQRIVGPLPAKEAALCHSCKGSIVATTAEKVEGLCKLCVLKMDSNDRSLPSASPLRRSPRNASDKISSQDTNKGSILSEGINGGSISSQDVVEGKIAKDREVCLTLANAEGSALELVARKQAMHSEIVPRLSVGLRRSGRHATGCLSSPDVGQGKIAEDRSLKSFLAPVTPKSTSGQISPEGKSDVKTAERPVEFSGSISAILQEDTSQKIIPMSSKAILGSRTPKSSSVSVACNSSQQTGKITRKSSKAILGSRTPKSSSVSVACNSSQQTGKITRKSSKAILGSRTPKSSSVSVACNSSQQTGKITRKSSKASLGSRTPRSSSVSVASRSSQRRGKITKKDQRLHRSIFEDGGMPDGTEVAYFSEGKKLLEGYKQGDGIYCWCCKDVVSASVFEAHAGRASRRKPYNYIYTSNGVSMHEFSVSLLKTRKSSAKDNDDLCSICADGGDLLLCDGCPRAFHKECASLPSVPSGKWYCQYCQNMFVREKFVESNINALAAGRVAGVDLIGEITRRCVRVVTTREQEQLIACVLCRNCDFSKSGFGPRTVIVCDQCEKEHHIGCLKEHNIADLEELPMGKWFCSNACRNISNDLQNLLDRGEEEIQDNLLSVIKQKYKEKEEPDNCVSEWEVKWRVLNGKTASKENRLILSNAVSLFHESFDPIVDTESGTDYIPSMVYGRSIKNQDFTGMHTAVLTVNSSVVSVALFRVLGQDIAEIPLVATSQSHQRKGYFQLLYSCLEKLLACLNVKKVVLPAAPEAESIWKDKFGFQKMDSKALRENRKTFWQVMSFYGTCMLQKAVPTLSAVQEKVIDAELVC